MSIWKYKSIQNLIENSSTYLTLEEGDTPVEFIENGDKKIFIKREDKNPSGSWKDRATAFKLTQLISQSIKEAVLFSSGNALISFLNYINQLNLDFKMYCVVSENINKNKLNLINELVIHKNHELIISKNPKKEAISLSAKLEIPNLRISLDNNIQKAYWSLGYELFTIIKNRDPSVFSIFIPASSGTALVGIVEGLFQKLGEEYKMPKIFVCQTDRIHPFSKDSNIVSSTEDSLADAIVDSVGLRIAQVQKIVKETGGDVLVISNAELEHAKQFAINKGIVDLSYNSLLSLAGFLQAGSANSNSVVVASGR